MSFSLGYVGQGFLYLAAVFTFLSLVFPQRKFEGVYLGAILGAFITLLSAHLISDFSVLGVYENSRLNMPWYYKVGSLWGYHEGSLLLWITLFSGLGFITQKYLSALYLKGFQHYFEATLLALILFLIFSSDPFTVLLAPPQDGLDLNPSLQDKSLLIHPPILYAGYILTAIPWAYSLSACQNALDENQRLALKKAANISLMLMVMGLTLGSVWAYYELGWGGYWFWDPVESLSLLPLISQLLHHHQLLAFKREEAQNLPLIHISSRSSFIIVLWSMFLVRSGYLTSVHSFAVDHERGLFLLGLCFVVTFASFRNLTPAFLPKTLLGFSFSPLVIILTIITAGVISPLVLKQFGSLVALSPHYYIWSLLPVVAIMVFLMTQSIFNKKSWRAGSLAGDGRHLNTFILAALSLLLTGWLSTRFTLLSGIYIFLGVWLMAVPFTFKIKSKAINFGHGGFGLLIAAAGLHSLFSSQAFVSLEPGKTTTVQEVPLSLQNIYTSDSEESQTLTAQITLENSVLRPKIITYVNKGTQKHKTALKVNPLRPWHITPLELNPKGTSIFQISRQDYVHLVWLGAAIMVGGFWFSFRKKKKIQI